MTLNSQSPFDLNNDIAYQEWRALKLASARNNQNKTFINIKKTPPHFYDVLPIDDILTECNLNNYCLYKLEDNDNLDSTISKQLIHKLAHSCGISHLDNNICADEDSLTSIYNKNTNNKREYIPYTNKKLSWHTDGYYNTSEQKIYSMLLHCHSNAESGGESAFIDHEIVYILLRDKNPNWIKALSHPQAMTIPANVLNGKVIREAQSGPVFSLSPTGRLHMRYSARTKHIVWRKNNDTEQSIEFIKKLLDLNSDQNNSEYIIKHKLRSGEGIITRNILHCRSAFEDNGTNEKQRLLFRGRFYDELPNNSKVS